MGDEGRTLPQRSACGLRLHAEEEQTILDAGW